MKKSFKLSVEDRVLICATLDYALSCEYYMTEVDAIHAEKLLAYLKPHITKKEGYVDPDNIYDHRPCDEFVKVTYREEV